MSAPFTHDQQTGAPRTWHFAGRDWPVSGLTPYQLGQLEAWLKDHVPSPLAVYRQTVKEGDWAPEERKVLFDEARVAMVPAYDDNGLQIGGWPPSFNSCQGQALLFQGTGIAAFLRVVLAKHTPTLTTADAEALAPLLSVDDLRGLTELIQVRGPEDDAEPATATTIAAEPADDDPDIPPLPAGYVDPKA